MKKIILFVLILPPLVSQGQVRSEFWTKAYIENAIDQHWYTGVDLLKKTQNDYFENDHNLFRKSLTTGGRFWVLYKTKTNWHFLVSPFGWITTDDLKKSGDLSSSNEFRVTTGALKIIKFSTVNNSNRILVEFRDMNLAQSNHVFQTRYRLLNRFDIPVGALSRKDNLDYVASNEFCYKVQSGRSDIDQNRIFNGIAFKHLHSSEIIAGYQYTSQNTSAGIVRHHQVLLFFNIFL